VQAAQGDLVAALKSYETKRDIISRLAASDPGNAGWQRDLSVSYDKVGDVQMAQGNLKAALKSYSDSLAIAERLAASDPGNAQWQYDLGISNERIGDVQVAQGLLLPTVIRALGLANAGRQERHDGEVEEYKARRQGIEAVIKQLDQLASERNLSDDFIRPLRARQRDRLKHIVHRSDGDDGHRKLTELHDEIELLLIAAERQHINEFYRSGALKDEARRRIERELDLREVDLANQQSEE
jgi:tetratricopeptide (TPR) repeat protein